MTKIPIHKTNISNEEINALPLGAFEGKVVVITKDSKLDAALDEINEHRVVGFDTETKPVFVRGHSNLVALMQIALPHKVFLIRLSEMKLQGGLVDFLQNDKILKAGVALRDDIKGLQKLHPYEPGGFVELAEMSKAAGLQVESVKKLAALVLGFRISKSAQTSNWEAETLNEKQISYAATDAWVCLEVYNKLAKMLYHK
ncbi:MAG: 3'-5' exonuclease domain-containing protein 2 [Cyclobacteriaceae bacterium]|nr:3'-5' exonuclease domain-containing protein 2 [Cyclobacteriaceae bacterium]